MCKVNTLVFTGVKTTLFFFLFVPGISPVMNLPHWVEQRIEQLPSDFSGRLIVTIDCWAGGVANLDISTKEQAPKPTVSSRHALNA